MKAAVVLENKIVIKDVPVPALKDKGALIQIKGCGLCGSDIVKFKHNVKDGTVLGHEIVGEIVEIKSDTDFSVGDKIVMGHHVPCYECVYCKGESYSMCRHFKTTNILPGGFAQYIFASEEHLKNTVFKIPQGLDDVTASFTEPLACCLRAVHRANLKQNSKVLVIGLGSIGLLMGQALKAYSHSVCGADLLDERLKIAQKSGFDFAVKTDNELKTKETFEKITDGIGFDAVFMTAGASKTLPVAISSVRDGGKIVVFSSINGLEGYANNEIYYRELSVIGSYSPAPSDLKESLELLADSKVKVQGFSNIYEFDKIQEAFDDTINNKILKAYVEL